MPTPPSAVHEYPHLSPEGHGDISLACQLPYNRLFLDHASAFLAAHSVNRRSKPHGGESRDYRQRAGGLVGR